MLRSQYFLIGIVCASVNVNVNAAGIVSSRRVSFLDDVV